MKIIETMKQHPKTTAAIAAFGVLMVFLLSRGGEQSQSVAGYGAVGASTDLVAAQSQANSEMQQATLAANVAVSHDQASLEALRLQNAYQSHSDTLASAIAKLQINKSYKLQRFQSTLALKQLAAQAKAAKQQQLLDYRTHVADNRLQWQLYHRMTRVVLRQINLAG